MGQVCGGGSYFLARQRKKNVAEFHSALLFVGTLFFLSYSWKKKEEAPKRFSSSLCIFYSISPSSFFCCGRGRAVIPHFAFSSAASSSFYFWGDSAVAIRTNGTHTHNNGDTIYVRFFSPAVPPPLSHFPLKKPH